jgi:hypothetical protein
MTSFGTRGHPARRGARLRRVSFAIALSLALPGVAGADVDLSNDWVVRFTVGQPLTCDLRFAQSGGSLTATGDCRGYESSAGFSGTVDPQTGSFSLVGSIFFHPPIPPAGVSFAGAPVGDGSQLAGTANVDGQDGTFFAGLCGNGSVDAGEACDDGIATNGCCTAFCTPRTDGISCQSTAACQIAPTCSAGACVGAPKPAGTECEADANACTDDACDGAGSCAAGPCSPCCGGPSCRPEPRYDSCTQPSDTRDLIDVQVTPFGTRDLVRWTVPHLGATSSEDLPDPQTTDYALCFYMLDADDEFSVLAFDVVAPAGLGCGRARCWTESPTGGVAYNGGALRPDGVVSLRVKPGAEGKAKVSVVGRGPNLDVRSRGGELFDGGELLLELHAGESCWSAHYFNLGQHPDVRTGTRYRKKGHS